MTLQRRIILESLSGVRTHPTADEVYETVRRQLPRISLGTVYRNLEVLSEQGHILTIEIAGSPKRFDPATKRHYHIRCEKCGRFDDLEMKPLRSLAKIISESGYEVTSYNLEFAGVCPHCRGKSQKAGAGETGAPGHLSKTGPVKTSGTALQAFHLDDLYNRLNKREFVHPDPLEFLYSYADPRDREIVALLASSLAYGRVSQILKSISWLLSRMPQPCEFVQHAGFKTLRKTFQGFKHRFTSGDEVASMLHGAGRAITKWGSLENCYKESFRLAGGSMAEALPGFVNYLKSESAGNCDSLLPDPDRGSACKRLNLFLRWMVRCDEVDPGGWYNFAPIGLVVPLDVHMHRIARALGFTSRSQADMRTAIEVTESFRKFAPNDPVKYDFALTRLGIRDDMDPVDLQVYAVRSRPDSGA